MSCIEGDFCIICRQGFSESNKCVTVTKKGLSTLILCSEKRGWTDLKKYLNEQITNVPIGKVLVHVSCRRDFTDQKRLSNVNEKGNQQLKNYDPAYQLLAGLRTACFAVCMLLLIPAIPNGPPKYVVWRPFRSKKIFCSVVEKGKMNGHRKLKIGFMGVLIW